MSPRMLGFGMNERSVCAAGSIRESGTMLPGNGCPVSGSITTALAPEKSPARAASVGTVEYESTGVVRVIAGVVQEEGRPRARR